MSPWPREPLALGLDAGTLAGAGVHLASTESAWTVAALAAALKAARAQHGNTRAARLLLAPDLCRHFVLAAPGGLRAFAELRGLAAARAAQIFGDGAWAVVADWSLTQPFACAALPQPLLSALLEAAREAGLVLGLESAVLAALAQTAPPPGFVAFATPGHLVLAHHNGHGLDALRCVRRPAPDGGETLQANAAREAARESLRLGSAPAALQWLEPLAVAAPDSEAAWASRLAAQGGR